MAVQAHPNSNFTLLSANTEHVGNDPRYLRYRRHWMENPRHFVVDDFPIHLDIEATNKCNLRCSFCDKLPYLKPDDFGMLEFDLFTRIIDEGADNGLCGLKLSYRGEPLLHPRLTEMVAYAKQRGILDVYFNTNAMLLNQAKVQALMDAGLDRISVSIEGTDPVAFERARVGAKFDVIKRNLENLLNVRAQFGSNSPRVRVQTVALPGIDLTEYASYWSAFADEVAAIDYKETVKNKTLTPENWACPQLWQRMTMEWNGRIMPCNNDDLGLLSPGNVKSISIADAWRHPIVAKAREMHKSGLSHGIDACNGCPWRTAQVEKMRQEKGVWSGGDGEN